MKLADKGGYHGPSR